MGGNSHPEILFLTKTIKKSFRFEQPDHKNLEININFVKREDKLSIINFKNSEHNM